MGSFPFRGLFLVLLFGSPFWCGSLNAAVSASKGQGSSSASWTYNSTTRTFSVSISLTVGPDAGGTNAGVSYVLYDLSGAVVGVTNLRHQNNGDSVPRTFNYNNTFSIPADRYVTFTAYVQQTTPSYVEAVSSSPVPEIGFQSVSLAPNGGAASIVSGQSFHGTASGAQAGNPYNISVVSGDGSASINSSTGAYTIIANGPGLITYKVWISSGGGYARSADAQASIAVAQSKKIKVTIPANTGAFSVRWELRQGGVLLGTYLQVPGAVAQIVTVNVPDQEGEVVLWSKVIGASKDDNGNWFVDPTDETDLLPSDPMTPQLPDSDGNLPDNTPQTNTPTTPANEQKSPRLVWSQGTQSSDPSQQKDLLTNATYREGVQNIVDSVNGLKEKPETPQSAQAEAESAMHSAVEDAMSKATDMANVFSQHQLAGPTSPNIVVSSGGESITRYHVVGPGGRDTRFDINLNPFGNIRVPSWLRDLLSLSRAVLAVTAIGWLYIDVMRQCREAVLGALQVNRVGEFLVEKKLADAFRSVPVVGGFVGSLISVAGRVILFSIFAAIILTLPATVATILDLWGSIGYESYRAELHALLSSEGILGVVLSMAVGVVPIPTLLVCFATRMVCETILNGGVVPIAIYIKLFRL